MEVRVLNVNAEILSKLEDEETLETTGFPNEFIEVNGPDKTRIVRVDNTGQMAHLLPVDRCVHGIKPKNKEQAMALDLLMDDTVPVVIFTGIAGSGKTLLSMAASIHKYDTNKYKKIIFTRPMSQVGRYKLGTLPGDVSEKFSPYLGNFETNLLHFNSKSIEHFMKQYNIDTMPIQLVRGCSFIDTFIICDESQVLGHHEMLTIGTRIGERSKIVIMGDLKQRDENIKESDTGLSKIINSNQAIQSPLIGHVDLIHCERSEVSKLFSNIFAIDIHQNETTKT